MRSIGRVLRVRIKPDTIASKFRNAMKKLLGAVTRSFRCLDGRQNGIMHSRKMGRVVSEVFVTGVVKKKLEKFVLAMKTTLTSTYNT